MNIHGYMYTKLVLASAFNLIHQPDVLFVEKPDVLSAYKYLRFLLPDVQNLFISSQKYAFCFPVSYAKLWCVECDTIMYITYTNTYKAYTILALVAL